MPIYFFYPCDSIESLYSNLPFVSLLTSPSRFNLVNSNWMIILGNFSIANIQPERRPSDRHVLFPGIIAAAERLAPPLERQRSPLWLMKLHHDYKELKDQGIGATPESFSSPMPKTGQSLLSHSSVTERDFLLVLFIFLSLDYYLPRHHRRAILFLPTFSWYEWRAVQYFLRVALLSFC